MAAGSAKQWAMRKRSWPLAWLVIACWLWLSASALAAATAGPRFHIDSFGTHDGLPANEIVAMTQTRDGYLWLGTPHGLIRFDGVEFKVFDEHNTPGLTSEEIVFLFEDSKTNLWIGTATAGALLDQGGRITSLGFGEENRDGRLVAAYEDATGGVWLRTDKGALRHFADGKMGEPHLLEQGQNVTAQKAGPLWDGVEKWVSEKMQGKQLPHPWPEGTAISAACEDLNGNLVVGTKGAGVWWFGTNGEASHISQKEGLSGDYVFSLLVDNGGSLWVGLDGGGLNRVQRQFIHPFDASDGLVVHSVCEDGEGRRWFSSTIRGVDYWKDGVLKNANGRLPISQISRFDARGLLVDRAQTVWAATFNAGLFCWNNGQFSPAPENERINARIYAIFQDRSGLMWAGTQQGLACWNGSAWRIFTTNDGLGANIVRAIAEGPEQLWIGTEGGGLNCLQEGKITHFSPPKDFPAKNISSLYFDREGVLWVGTLGNGLFRVQGQAWVNYTTDSGLNGNGVDYIIEDDEGCLWIGSNAGLTRVKKSDLNDFADGKLDFIPCHAYGERDGLPSSECTPAAQPAAWRDRDGTLWFPTIKGLASLNPAEIQAQTNSFPVLIESVLVEGQTQGAVGPHGQPPQSVTVPAGKELLEIRYVGLNLDAPQQVRFRYRMDGYDSAGKWTEAGTRRAVQYAKLPPGPYQFQVSARNEDGTWNNATATFAVAVLPAYWQTLGFRGAVIAALLAVISAFVYFISTQKLQRQLSDYRQQQAVEKDRARIARDIHDQVGASLTQLSLLGEMVESDKENPAEVEAAAGQIIQTARETARALDEIVWTVNPSNDTLEGLVNYICKHAQEYLAVAGLRFRLEAPAQLPPAEISPEARHNIFLAAKESVTNIVKHAQATEACIRLRLKPGGIILEIEDNGRGPAGHTSAAAQTRNGMRNMRKRMEDSGGTFEILRAASGGTLIRLTAPIRPATATTAS
jgi:ligand-binding sensor domain-containing protein/signal transduction histidine kinase